MTSRRGRGFPALALLFATGFCFAQTALTVTSVRNGASFTNRITPGSFVTIFGTGFATGPESEATLPVPDILGGVSVSIAGIPCPIYYVNPTQINLLVPWTTPVGTYPMTVTVNDKTVGPTNIVISAEAPGIFQYGANRAVAQNLNGNSYSLNTSSAPAAVGSTLVVYVTGIGMVSNTPGDGATTPASPLSQASYLNSATIGGVPAAVTFLGLTPGQVGLAQADITVPSLPSGDYPLVLTVAGLESTSALVSVQGASSGLPLVLTQLSTLAVLTTPLEPPLQGPGHTAGNVAISGNYAYFCDANGIAIFDVSNPASPKYISNFGEYDLNGAGQGCALYQGNLVEYTTGLFIVYSLGTPTAPQRIGLTQFYFGSTFFSGTNAYIWSQIYDLDPTSFAITNQTGDFSVYDLTNPVAPVLDAQLEQNSYQPGNVATSPQLGLAVFNNQTAIVLGTSTTAAMNPGQALWNTINVTNPASPSFVGQTLIPKASIAVNLCLQGNLALVAGNTAQPVYSSESAYTYGGNLTLHAVDFTNPLSPTILSTLVTNLPATGGYAMTSLGGGFFAVTLGPPLTDLHGPTTLAIVDARNPASLVVYPEYGIDNLQGITFASGNLYTVSNAGLTVYSVTLP